MMVGHGYICYIVIATLLPMKTVKPHNGKSTSLVYAHNQHVHTLARRTKQNKHQHLTKKLYDTLINNGSIGWKLMSNCHVIKEGAKFSLHAIKQNHLLVKRSSRKRFSTHFKTKLLLKMYYLDLENL